MPHRKFRDITTRSSEARALIYSQTSEILKLPFTFSIAMAASGIAVGLNKGHITARRELKVTPSYKKGVRINLMIDEWMDGMDGIV